MLQVSNWFANARRRLKNTVRQPDLSWALRIKLYNKYVQGNAERLSISSDDSASEGERDTRKTRSFTHSPSTIYIKAYLSWVSKSISVSTTALGGKGVGLVLLVDPFFSL